MREFVGGLVLLSSSVALAALPPGWERAREIGMVVADVAVYDALQGRPIEVVTYKGPGKDGEQRYEVYEVRAEACAVEVHLDYLPAPEGLGGAPLFQPRVAKADGCDRPWLSTLGRAVVTQSLTTDAAVRVNVEGDGRVDISAGIGGPIKLDGGEVGLALDGQSFIVETQRGQPVVDALAELREQIEAGGYLVVEEALGRFDTLRVRWTITPLT
ncbi:MAG TPA: hypothetical protein VFH51_16685 [Myxococcota bacterium]|nr:hypothetical protein [Myxococcota bacterium]